MVCSALIWQASTAAFSDATSNGPNTLGAGTVTIADDDGGSAMFTAANLAPGATDTMCVGVRYTGSLSPSAIRMYFTGRQESDAGTAYAAWQNNSTFSEMDDDTTMQIQVSSADLAANPGMGSAAANCTPAGYGAYSDVVAAGTGLNTLLNSYTAVGSSLPSQWGTIVANQWRIFKLTYIFSAAAGNSAQGDGVKFTVVWEAQS
jgi:hypothetical protein